MPDRMMTPKFFTAEVAQQAIESVLAGVMNNHDKLPTPFLGERRPALVVDLLKRRACHIVVLVPSMKDDSVTDWAAWPVYQLEPCVLYEISVGDKCGWTAEYDKIARCKALQLWHERNDGRTDIVPHLLFPGDTPYWGGVKRDGIVVACSGVQPWFDRMISGMVADACIGLAYNGWMTSKDKAEDLDFVS